MTTSNHPTPNRHDLIEAMLRDLEPLRDTLITLTETLAQARYQAVDGLHLFELYEALETQRPPLLEKISTAAFEQQKGIIVRHPRSLSRPAGSGDLGGPKPAPHLDDNWVFDLRGLSAIHRTTARLRDLSAVLVGADDLGGASGHRGIGLDAQGED